MLQLEDEEELEVAIEMTYIDDRLIAAEPTGPIWHAAPERALIETRSALSKRRASAFGWFFNAPAEYSGFLLDQLDTLEQLPEWAQDWARDRVRVGGDAAERLFQLSRGRWVPRGRTRDS
jgi:hypothetical protein